MLVRLSVLLVLWVMFASVSARAETVILTQATLSGLSPRLSKEESSRSLDVVIAEPIVLDASAVWFARDFRFGAGGRLFIRSNKLELTVSGTLSSEANPADPVFSSFPASERVAANGRSGRSGGAPGEAGESGEVGKDGSAGGTLTLRLRRAPKSKLSVALAGQDGGTGGNGGNGAAGSRGVRGANAATGLFDCRRGGGDGTPGGGGGAGGSAGAGGRCGAGGIVRVESTATVAREIEQGSLVQLISPMARHGESGTPGEPGPGGPGGEGGSGGGFCGGGRGGPQGPLGGRGAIPRPTDGQCVSPGVIFDGLSRPFP
jgi:hypothetical protein